MTDSGYSVRVHVLQENDLFFQGVVDIFRDSDELYCAQIFGSEYITIQEAEKNVLRLARNWIAMRVIEGQMIPDQESLGVPLFPISLEECQLFPKDWNL